MIGGDRRDCRHYYEDEDRFKCTKGHACFCRFGEPCKDFETYEEYLAKKKEGDDLRAVFKKETQ